jgi:CheY-like chemotaxis protein
VKFTPPGGRVGVSVERRGSRARVTVRDNGEGIPADFLPRLFERFAQAPAATRLGGLGLGLSIAKHLAELHGGTVRGESDGPGRGAVFTVELPLIRETPAPPAPSASPAGGGTVGGEPPRLDGLRVLVVDDDPDTCEVMGLVLSSRGAEVCAAHSAAAALELLGSLRPDVLLCDLGMPDRDGYDLIREVRSRPPGSGGDVPAAACTAHAAESDRRRVAAAGFHMLIAKPAEAAVLARAVARLAGRDA